MKVCIKCNTLFTPYRSWQTYCSRKCRLGASGVRWYNKNVLKIHSTIVASRRKRTYGITREQYETLLLTQNNVCAICKCPESSKINGKIKQLSVDHDHKTGKNRGLLCNNCNRAIGLLKDDRFILQEAINYLTVWMASH